MSYDNLTTQEAKLLLERHGFNEIKDTNKVHWYTILSRQFKNNFVVYLLLFAAFLSFLVKNNTTGYTIFVVIFLVVGIGFFQEFKAEKAISSLKKMITPTTLVLRDSKEKRILSKEIVPGDVLILRAGERVPADGYLLEENNLFVNESVLTGESIDVKKHTLLSKPYKDENLLFTGSFITSGRCYLKVINTGMHTKFGNIAKLISSSEKQLPLQKKVNKITTLLALAGLFLSILAGILILVQAPVITKQVLVNVVILVIAISVSVFPEGFPVVLITTLSIGAHRMSKKNAIVNRMSIIETLGQTTVICSDKTGTITKGEMTVNSIYLNDFVVNVSGIGYSTSGSFLKDNKPFSPRDNPDLSMLLKSAVVCNDSFIEQDQNTSDYKVIGSSTETSLLVLAAKADIYKNNFEVSRLREIPFSSKYKMMSVLVQEKDSKSVYLKGAPEVVLNHSTHYLKNGKIYKLTKTQKDLIFKQNQIFTKSALRTLAFAYKQTHLSSLENNFIFIGLVGMIDPPREEVKGTIKLCKQAGIKVKMITGDHKDTAIAIAKQIGIFNNKVLTGDELDNLTDSELLSLVNDFSVFARVRPDHKLRIVKALKANKEIVTMTGDGVNDAPALKEANVGVAMGLTGTDVSRDVADITLKDDNFATIVHAVKEGRTIFSNIRKFITFQLSCNFSEVLIIIFGVLLASRFNWPIPLLLPLQILFMNIVTDNIPSIALGFNKSSHDIMQEKARKKGLITKSIFLLILFTSFFMTFFTLLVFYVSFNIFKYNAVSATTAALVTLIMLEVLGAFIFRSFRKPVFTRSLFVNKYLFFASLISILATLLIIYTPLNSIFSTSPLFFYEWIVALLIGFLFVLLFDILKIVNNKRSFWKVE